MKARDTLLPLLVALPTIVCASGCDSGALDNADAASRTPASQLEAAVASEATATGLRTKQLSVSFGGLSVSPVGVAPLANGILIVDNGRSLLLHARLGSPGVSAVAKVSVGSLDFPIGVRHDGEQIFVWDREGLLTLSDELDVRRRIRSFRSVYDFLPLDDGRLVLSLFEDHRDRPNLVLADSSLTELHSWRTDTSVAALRPGLGGLVHLANCGPYVVGALAYEPVLVFIDPSSLELTTRPVSAPWVERLSVETFSSGDGGSAPPSRRKVVTGAACSAGALFLLTPDRGRLRLTEFDLDGSFRRVLLPSDTLDLMSFESLVAVQRKDGTSLYTVGRPRPGERVIITMDAPPHISERSVVRQ